jgi:hypothetical protein
MDEKLIALVRKCEELYGMSNKKYSDGVWREKLWERICEVLKSQVSFNVFLIEHFEVTIVLPSSKF